MGNTFSCFELENVSFSSQEMNLKQRSPAGSGKKKTALMNDMLVIQYIKDKQFYLWKISGIKNNLCSLYSSISKQ